MKKNSFSIASIRALQQVDPGLTRYLERTLAATYSDFLAVLHADLHAAATRLEENPQFIPDEPEDATTRRLLDMLSFAGYGTEHGSSAGGSVDITIRAPRAGYRWIGEAKKYTSVSALKQGFLQLTTRYKAAMDERDCIHAGLIAYLREPNTKSRVEAWKSYFQAEVASGQCELSECTLRPQRAFHSTHTDATHGVPSHVWHVCLNFFHEPQDASGIATRQRRSKRSKSD